jgi:L-galactose dehydrogenase
MRPGAGEIQPQIVRRFHSGTNCLVHPGAGLSSPATFMQYRKLGKTGWKISVLGLGAQPLGGAYGPVNEKEGTRTVRSAVDLGINFVDVSPYYGLTRAESLLGKALRGIPREQYYLATKIGRYGPAATDFDFSAARVARSVDESLRRLGVAHIDLIQCHDIEYAPMTQLIAETIPALHKLKRQGKVRKIGVTGLPLKVFPRVLDQAAVDAVQTYCHYCLNDITLVQLLPYLREKEVGIINSSPLGMGLLTEKGPPDWHPAPVKIRTACAQAAQHCARRKESFARLALQFAASQRDISTTIVGTSNEKKIKQNVRWLEEPLDQRLLAEVQEILAPIRNQSWPSGRLDNP